MAWLFAKPSIFFFFFFITIYILQRCNGSTWVFERRFYGDNFRKRDEDMDISLTGLGIRFVNFYIYAPYRVQISYDNF